MLVANDTFAQDIHKGEFAQCKQSQRCL